MPRLLPFLLLAAASAHAADRVVTLRKLPPVSPRVEAMPEILRPRDAAERAINLALRGLDARARSTPRQDGCPIASHTRGVRPTMTGPGFLSFLVTDELDCGEHPSVQLRSIVFDLRLGKPVDWSRLLPQAYLAGGSDAPRSLDPAPLVAVASRRLYQLYLAGYPREQDADCQQVVRDTAAETAPPPVTLWLDAAADGLAVRFDLPHAVQACAEVVTIPVDTLRNDGAEPSLTGAIEAAHATEAAHTTEARHTLNEAN